MKTLKNVWERLKGLLQSAVHEAGKTNADSKAIDAAARQFTTSFLHAFAEIEKQYKAKEAIEVELKKSTTEAMKLAQTLKQKLAAAGADDDDLKGRVDEIFDRLKELNQYGFQVQWD